MGLVTVLLKIGTEYYETWWNWHNPYCHSCFEDIANQEMLRILFFVDNHNCQFSLEIQNDLKKHFTDYRKELEDLSSWSMDNFNLEREKIYKMYPSPQSLWAITVA